MADIIVKMLNPSVYTFHIKNRETFNVDLDMPVAVIDMPENSKAKAVATKLTGNVMKITVIFLLKDYTGDVPTLVDELTGGSAILTIDQQINFLLNTFENRGLDYRYRLSISDTNPPFSYDGVVDKISIDQSEETAHNYRCTITFTVADVITVSS